VRGLGGLLAAEAAEGQGRHSPEGEGVPGGELGQGFLFLVCHFGVEKDLPLLVAIFKFIYFQPFGRCSTKTIPRPASIAAIN